jgi:hypothetical protein
VVIFKKLPLTRFYQEDKIDRNQENFSLCINQKFGAGIGYEFAEI